MTMLKKALMLPFNNKGFWGNVIGAVIGGAANLLGGDRANDAQMDMLKYQLDYNKPINQMRRYEEAGLNPYLAISGGNPGNATAIPDMSAKGKGIAAAGEALGSGIARYAEIANMKAQNDNLYAQNKLLQAQTAQTVNATSMHTMDTLQRIEKMKSEIAETYGKIGLQPYDKKVKEAQSELNKLEKEIRERDFAFAEEAGLPYSNSVNRTVSRLNFLKYVGSGIRSLFIPPDPLKGIDLSRYGGGTK